MARVHGSRTRHGTRSAPSAVLKFAACVSRRRGEARACRRTATFALVQPREDTPSLVGLAVNGLHLGGTRVGRNARCDRTPTAIEQRRATRCSSLLTLLLP